LKGQRNFYELHLKSMIDTDSASPYKKALGIMLLALLLSGLVLMIYQTLIKEQRATTITNTTMATGENSSSTISSNSPSM
jgi:hypothetical protein